MSFKTKSNAIIAQKGLKEQPEEAGKNPQILRDLSTSGKERPWHKHKVNSLRLSESYQRLGLMSKAVRVKECGGYLRFGECEHGHGTKLKEAKFCQVRLCPMCSWRKSQVIFTQLNRITHVAASRQKNLSFLFLTLTVRNVGPDQLASELDKLFHAWNKLMKRREVKPAIVGWFRGLEVTHDVNEYITPWMYENKKRRGYYKKLGLKVGDLNPSYDTYHPHFHVLLAVPPSFFAQKYISQQRWVELWQESLGVDYAPVVHIQKVKPKREGQTVEGAVAEIGKYAVKGEDYLTDDLEQTDLAVSVFDSALANRRLVAYGGILREIRKELKLADVEEADLIHVDDEDESKHHKCSVCGSDLMEVVYTWNFGLRNYVRKD